MPRFYLMLKTMLFTLVALLVLFGFLSAPTEANTPVTLLVDTTNGTNNDGDSATCSFAEAIDAVNNHMVDRGRGCPIADEENIIAFAPTLDGATISLENMQTISPTDGLSITLLIDASDLTQGITLTNRRININTGVVTLKGLTISGIQSNGAGGGLRQNNGVLTLDQMVVRGNQSNTHNGGGLYVERGTTYIYNSLFTENFATTSGGGVFINASATLAEIYNTTISGNTANSNGGGLVANTAVTLTNVTIGPNVGGIDPRTGYAGAPHNVYRTGTLYVYNSMIAQETGGGTACIQPGGFDPTAVSDHSIAEDASCQLGGAADLENVAWASVVDTNLVNGVHVLLPNSVAIDAGDNAVCAGAQVNNLDQRQVVRPQDGDDDTTAVCDIGAFEAPAVRQVSGTGNYTFGGVTINVGSVGNIDTLLVEEFAVNHPQATGSAQGDALKTGRYWHVQALDVADAEATGYTLTLTLPYAFANGDSRVCKYTAGPGFGWDCDDALGSNTSVGTGVVTRTNIMALSEWAVGNNVGPTAVTWQYTGTTSGTAPVYGVWVAFAALAVLTLAVRIFNGIRTF